MRANGNGLESAAEVLSSPLILGLRGREMDLLRNEAQLLREYGERHPVVLELKAEQQNLADRIAYEIDNVIANLENEAAVARSRERAHAERLRAAKGQSVVTCKAAVQLRELEREVAASRSLYQSLLVRLKETEQQQEIVQADVRLISPAQMPDAPSSPSPKLFATVGFTASLVLGSILALLLEQLDGTLRTGGRSRSCSACRRWGWCPRSPRRARHPAAPPHDRPAAARPMPRRPRAPHPGLPRRDGRPPPAISWSPRPCPAKARPRSPRASRCSRSSSAIGRCSSISTSAAPPSRGIPLPAGGGVLALLDGTARFEDAVRRDPYSGVDLLAAGDDHGNPITLLTSERLIAVLGAAREHYDRCHRRPAGARAARRQGAVARERRDPVRGALGPDRAGRRRGRDQAARRCGRQRDGGRAQPGRHEKHASYAYGDAAQYYLEYSRSYADEPSGEAAVALPGVTLALPAGGTTRASPAS